MRTIDCEQGSEQWRLARLGKVGASMVADATARTKSGWGASRANLAARLVIERLTGNPSQSFITPAMQHGIDTEPEARRTYAFVHCVEVSQIGLVLHPTIDGAVASPDGLVHENGLVEIKCPQAARHLQTLLGAEVDGGYLKQVQWQMACTGRQWCDFVSFNPSFPAEMQLHVKRITRDDKLIGELEEQIGEFLKEVEFTCAKLVETYKQPIAAE